MEDDELVDELVDIEEEEVEVTDVELEAAVEVAVLTEPKEKVRRVPSVATASVDRCDDQVEDEVELEDEVGDEDPEDEEEPLLCAMTCAESIAMMHRSRVAAVGLITRTILMSFAVFGLVGRGYEVCSDYGPSVLDGKTVECLCSGDGFVWS